MKDIYDFNIFYAEGRAPNVIIDEMEGTIEL